MGILHPAYYVVQSQYPWYDVVAVTYAGCRLAPAVTLLVKLELTFRNMCSVSKL